jgi:hypothetical protein
MIDDPYHLPERSRSNVAQVCMNQFHLAQIEKKSLSLGRYLVNVSLRMDNYVVQNCPKN